MLIRSQDKRHLVDVIGRHICIDSENNHSWIYVLKDNEKVISLGHYNDDNRCIEVLDEISEFIVGGNKIYTMPEK